MKQGWEMKRLGDVCETGAGGTPLKAHKDYYEGGTIPWLLSGEVSQGEIYKSENFITEKGLQNSSARLFPPDTVLVAMYGATAGQVGILKFECSTNQAVCGILPNKNYLPKFLYYCFLSKKDELISQAVGGAQPNISQIKIKNTLIPFIPLPEQQRIAFVLDEAFASIAQAKSNTERNLVNVRELFESEMEDVFENTPKGWDENKLGEVCEFEGGAQPPKSTFSKIEKEGYIRFIQIRDYKTDNHIVYIPLSKARRFCKKDDIMIGRYGPPVFQILEGLDGAYNVALMKAIPNEKKVSRDYMFLFLKHRKIQQYIINLSQRASGQTGISIDALKAFPIRYPPLAEQRAIVGRLEALSAETGRLEEIYRQKVAALEELKKSVLSKAFSGEL